MFTTMNWIVVSIFIFQISEMASATSTNHTSQSCRSQIRLHQTVESFELHAYAWCFSYLFFIKFKHIRVNSTGYRPIVFLFHKNRWFIFKSMDFKNDSTRAEVCSFLSDDECHRWTSCCSAAESCCQRQLSLPPEDNNTCRRIWDGWQCWDDADPGTKNYMACPHFLQYSTPTRQAVKTCQQNKEWVRRTDYTPCINYEELKTSIYIGLICSIGSILSLLPAIAIFLHYKSLRKQKRIRLHVHFFVALLLQHASTALWDMLVTYDKVTSKEVFDTTLLKNGVGCKLLSFLKIYFKCCCYAWMFCEGFYLHRLMSNAFSPPRSLIYLYALGWGIPLLSSSIYGILRGVINNESCWAYSYRNFEWIFDGPNVACLVLNLVFLSNILRILLTQIQTHPNEPHNFRRAVRATFILIPLFGTQLFVTLYRVPIGDTGGLEYERFNTIVHNTQGFFVAIVFCFLNGEVMSHLRKSWKGRGRTLSASKRLTSTLKQTLSTQSECEISQNGEKTQFVVMKCQTREPSERDNSKTVLLVRHVSFGKTDTKPA